MRRHHRSFHGNPITHPGGETEVESKRSAEDPAGRCVLFLTGLPESQTEHRDVVELLRIADEGFYR